jgi:hypothetical protein
MGYGLFVQAINVCAQGLLLRPEHPQLLMAQAESYASINGEWSKHLPPRPCDDRRLTILVVVVTGVLYKRRAIITLEQLVRMGPEADEEIHNRARALLAKVASPRPPCLSFLPHDVCV